VFKRIKFYDVDNDADDEIVVVDVID